MSNFKLLLIQANPTLDTLIPSSIATLVACVKQKGHEVKLFDTTFYKTREFTGDDARVETLQVKKTDFADLGIYLNSTDMIDDFRKLVSEYQPDLVGLSAVSCTWTIGRDLLRSVSDLHIPTIAGGIHPSIDPEGVIAEDSVDMICIGEGEGALTDLCDRMSTGKDITTVPNLWVKKDGRIHKNAVRPPVDIDTLPFQDWTVFDVRRRHKPMGGKIRITACIELNRGCPYSCSYCANDFLNDLYHHRNYRQRSIKRFIEEVKYLRDNYQIEFVYMSAETFLSASQERFTEFIDSYRNIKIPFWMETRPETITDDRIRLLKEVGCESITMGIESGDPDLRAKLLNRKMSDEQIVIAYAIIKKHGIRASANNIIGFPTETREQVFKTIELNRNANPDNVMVHIFNPYNGTRLYDLCVEKGYIPAGAIGGDYRSDIILEMPQLGSEAVRGLWRTFAMYVKFPKQMWAEIERAERFDAAGNREFERLSQLYREKFLT